MSVELVALHGLNNSPEVWSGVADTMRTADLRWHEPTLERLIEVHSTHATSEWFLMEALQRGYRMGVTAGSDSVDGRPGASHPLPAGGRRCRAWPGGSRRRSNGERRQST